MSKKKLMRATAMLTGFTNASKYLGSDVLRDARTPSFDEYVKHVQRKKRSNKGKKRR